MVAKVISTLLATILTYYELCGLSGRLLSLLSAPIIMSVSFFIWLLCPKRWKTFLCITEVCITYLWLYSCIIHLTTLTHQIHSIFPTAFPFKGKNRSFVINCPSFTSTGAAVKNSCLK